MIVYDHVLNVFDFDPAWWRFVCRLGLWNIYRSPNGFWLKGRPGGKTFHVQAINQVWDMVLEAGAEPPAELLADTEKERQKRRQAARDLASMVMEHKAAAPAQPASATNPVTEAAPPVPPTLPPAPEPKGKKKRGR